MPRPYIPGEHENESGLLVHGTLIERIGRQESVDVPGLEIRHHFRRRQNTYLHFRIGVYAAFGQIIAQQQIMHGIVKGNGKDEALHVLGGVHVLVIHAQGNGLPVYVFQSGSEKRHPGRPQAERHGNGHGGKHLRVIRLTGNRPVTYHGPAGCLVRLSFSKAIFLIESHRMCHNYRRTAGKGHKAYLHILLFYGAYGVKSHGLGCIQRKNAVDDRHGRRGAEHFHK